MAPHAATYVSKSAPGAIALATGAAATARVRATTARRPHSAATGPSQQAALSARVTPTARPPRMGSLRDTRTASDASLEDRGTDAGGDRPRSPDSPTDPRR